MKNYLALLLLTTSLVFIMMGYMELKLDYNMKEIKEINNNN